MKFGGTSVEDARAFENVISIVTQSKERKPVVVLSAIAGATDTLLKSAQLAVSNELEKATLMLNDLLIRHVTIAENLIDSRAVIQHLIFEIRKRFEDLKHLCNGIAILGELSKRSLDTIASTGELMSSLILSETMKSRGKAVEWVDARKLMITDDHFGNAVPLFKHINQKAVEVISPPLEENKIVITQGFIGATEKGITTTLGRGGSDYSATIIGAALDAEEIQIWTDVDGILTADPRITSNAKKLKVISYKEAAELAYFGAKVLHPSTIRPAVQKNIPVVVLNSKKPKSTGTKIVACPSASNVTVKSIANKKNISVINIQSSRLLNSNTFMGAILDVFNKYNTPVDLVSTSMASVSLTIDKLEYVDSIVSELEEFSDVTVFGKKAIVSIVGEKLYTTAGVIDRIFRSLADIDVTMISHGASDTNVSLVVANEKVEEVVLKVHREFFEPLPDSELFDDLL